MKNFEYVKVSGLSETIDLLIKHGEQAHILAGGTDVLVKMKQKQMTPELLLDIKGIEELEGIEYQEGKGMRIGALTTIREIETSYLVLDHLPVLASAAHLLGSVQIRHRATLGGNLCNALPSADTAPYLIGMEAKVVIVGPEGEKRLRVEDLFAGSGQNSLKCGEIVTAIEIPAWSSQTGGAYIKHAIKNAVDVAIVNVAVIVITDPSGKIFEEARIVLGAVGPRPIRPRKAEEYLRGKATMEDAISRAGELASVEAQPRTTIEYKRQMVETLTKRALKQALERIRGT